MRQRFTRILIVALVAAWAGILLTAGDSPAQLYRYTDKNGKIVFTDNPPPGVIVVPLEDEKEVAPGEVTPKEQGGKPSPQPQAGREPAVPVDRDKDAEMKRVADEEIQKKQEEVQKRLQERQQEKQMERQRRIAEAERLEKEASQPVQPTQENINRQMKLLQEAQRLRDMP
jgi:nucleosome binding factor SPN SPT16 subunit